MNRLLYTTLGLFLFTSTLTAQQLEIKGKIIDKDSKETLVGIAVQVKGTQQGVATDLEGGFTLRSSQTIPLTLVITGLGYIREEYTITAVNQEIQILLRPSVINTEEVVITASRVEESVMESPVAIEKLTIKDLRESPAPSLFDAIESVKGVQMTTLSMGFKVPNTRGFANTTNARFLSMVDGADTQAPGLGVSIANTVGPTELDIESIEIIPGASSALYGLNALNGTSNMITKSPFLYTGLSFYQQIGLNHLNSPDFGPKTFIQSALRYAGKLNDKWAFKVNIGWIKGTDWVANSTDELSPNSNQSTGLVGVENPGSDPLNSYGNENQNRKILTLADGKRYEIRRTGYYEKDLVNKNYQVSNIKADGAIHFKPNEKTEASYTYRIGTTDAVYQRGNRIRLDNYQIQQHKLTLRGDNYLLQGYLTKEHTLDSYNLRPIGENMDRAFKSDQDWFTDYSDAYNQSIALGRNPAVSHTVARRVADAGRFQPGTSDFDDKLRELAHINNWDTGAQLVMEHSFYHLEGQYDFKNEIKAVDLLVGADFRDFNIHPEGNSFSNPIGEDPFATLHYKKIGGFVQISRRFWQEKLKVLVSGRLDKTQYFDAKFNPRLAAVLSPNERHHIRTSVQNGFRFPTLFEAFSTVNNGGVIRYGGLELMSKNQQLFENSYLRSSVDAFQQANTADINNGIDSRTAVINNSGILRRNEYTYLVPEEIKAIDIGYKANLLGNRLYFDVDFYFNRYKNFIDQIEIAVPKTGIIGKEAGGIDPTWFEMESNSLHTRYRMWTNSKSIYENFGTSVGISYNFYRKMVISGNYSHAQLNKVDNRDNGLETPFNTPKHILNMNLTDRELMRNLGYSIAWRFQSAFEWKAPLANGIVKSYQTIDAQVSYKFAFIKTAFKLGGTNLLNNRYSQYTGGPEIGGFYYLSLTFDGFSPINK
ncbi:TonB-dependent receptor [Algoriphagus sp. Y33]|uniref:TonB-dependent receptor n=1 Tax=Algoriphagus sp. Y33 TaxID=2772483 RepID=UPI00177B496A|nr:TonB-dependent receptor [Algoriphagus sp. Y33]